MNIALISLHTSPLAQPGQGDAGGMNVYVRAVAEHLARAGHRVDVFTRDDGARYHAWDSTQSPHLISLPVGPAAPISKEECADLIPEFAAALTHWFASESYDVVHSHYWISGAATLDAVQPDTVQSDTAQSDIAQSPIFAHTMHTIAAVKNHSDTANTEHQHRLMAEKRLGQHCDVLVVNTDVEAKELGKFYGVDPARIAVVTPGVNLNLFTPHGPDHPWAEDPHFKIMFAGRIQPLKGPHVLVGALGLWKQEFGGQELPVSVSIAGETSGSVDLGLPLLAQRLGVAEHINFLGALPVKDLAGMFRAADVVVVPSSSESFGLVALEAQSCGTPVLAHRVGGLTWALADGVSGELLPNLEPATWKRALQRWQENPPQVAAYASRAREHAEKFSWDSTTEGLLSTYQSFDSNVESSPTK